MGQAFRRASGRFRPSSAVDTSSSKPKSAVDRRPPPPDKAEISKSGEQEALDAAGGRPRVNADNILEERDPKFDAMLGQMVGRISSKSGGKPEMGEAVVQKYNRPMPKLRNTKPESDRYEERPVPSGTLNVAQLRHVILLHEDPKDIAIPITSSRR
ncbi:NADH dehydrogenase [ubiquinone] 1 alpha subcomplex assembly factor 4 [Senna tora]|uniref:NADH dehydrogenase [ubiquinone] 1 alpha subcomplex assembly factor 4 n=1 Tax=Senna tora TaxID=362788 RepID=A0A834X537_9FABA|nr:NADH dehydrogenase [ubiquinone] 1 alpha subcomplex assembly factor 4 [Senna tora]